jgi:ubiquinone/menaquinone biosynthesis C-methylase UbiE
VPGVSFDRAAEYYDATRGYPPGVDDELRAALVRATGLANNARVLELGVGTGRIALPFIRAGHDYTGVDISRSMMARLQAKVADLGFAGARYRLLVGDVMRVPLATAFDMIVLVHVLHLVDDWRVVLNEARRVLKQGGALVLANDDHQQPDRPEPPDQVWPVWWRILDELGVPPEQRRASAVRGLDERFAEHLRSAGARVERTTLLTFADQARSARDVAHAIRDRICSSCWALPDDIHATAWQQLERWLAEQCPDPDAPFVRDGRVDALIARF